MDLTRIDVSRNARRFYRMEIVPGLFGGLVADRGVWPERPVRVDCFDTEVAAKDARFDIQMQKAKRGYE